jgi:cyclophilin family peptidyl-prolyl cis-trans isomerase
MIFRPTRKLLIAAFAAGAAWLIGCSPGGTDAQKAPAATDAKQSAAENPVPGPGAEAPPAEAKTEPGIPSFEGDDAAIAAIDAFIQESKIDKTQLRWKSALPMPPKVEFDPEKAYYWYLDTNLGNIKIKLMPDVAPMHVSSTLYLTRLGFYDGVRFHRVIPRFMAQGGDPDGKGGGGPGYTYSGEFDPAVKHDRPGLLSMANAGPGTDGSQFFLTFVPTPHLDGKHTLFGEIVDGMDTLRSIEARGSRRGKTQGRLVIEKATLDVEEGTEPGE